MPFDRAPKPVDLTARPAPDATSPAEGGRFADAATADRMAYLADMVAELKVMSDALGAETLSGILALAHVEASRAAQRMRASS